MKKLIIVILAVSFLFGVGCTKSVRYTEEEIQQFPPETQEQIRQGEVKLGMTTQQVRYAWGAPNSIKFLEPTPEGKTREQWVYSKLGVFATKLLVFVDGKLIFASGE
jgi:uncharacterized protein YneF (UPF0154 family)